MAGVSEVDLWVVRYCDDLGVDRGDLAEEQWAALELVLPHRSEG